MDKKPLVSSIIIFLDNELFLEEAITSILNQTYQNWELLLVDTGSNSESRVIAQYYAKRLSEKIRYLKQVTPPNQEPENSRRFAIKQAQGDYIGFLNPQDIWIPYKLEQQVYILNNYPGADMVYGKVKLWHDWMNQPEDVKLDYSRPLGTSPNRVVDPPELLGLMIQNQYQTATISDLLIRQEFLASLSKTETLQQDFSDQIFLAILQLKASIFVSDNCWTKKRYFRNEKIAITDNIEDHKKRLIFIKWLKNHLPQTVKQDKFVKDYLESELENYSIDKVTEKISASFPDFQIQNIHYLNQGINNRAYRVNGNYIFKFPKSEKSEESLIREVNVLQFLNKESIFKIPYPEFIKDESRLGRNPLTESKQIQIYKQDTSPHTDNDLFFVGYKELKGSFLYSKFVDQCSTEVRSGIAREIGIFLSSLHNLPYPEKVRNYFRSKIFNLRKYIQIYIYFFRNIATFLTPNERKQIFLLFWNNINNILLFKENYTLIHGDFNWDHIIFDENQKKVIGFIDFGSLRVGHPAYDFVGLLRNYGHKFLIEILEAYGKDREIIVVNKLIFRIQLMYCCSCIDSIISGLENNNTMAIKEEIQNLRHLAQNLTQTNL